MSFWVGIESDGERKWNRIADGGRNMKAEGGEAGQSRPARAAQADWHCLAQWWVHPCKDGVAGRQKRDGEKLCWFTPAVRSPIFSLISLLQTHSITLSTDYMLRSSDTCKPRNTNNSATSTESSWFETFFWQTRFPARSAQEQTLREQEKTRRLSPSNKSVYYQTDFGAVIWGFPF